MQDNLAQYISSRLVYEKIDSSIGERFLYPYWIDFKERD